MSTFVFAPSWVRYPNNPKKTTNNNNATITTTETTTITDEFPTLLGPNQNNNIKKNNSVWSNPCLIQKIHHSGDEDGDDIYIEERRYELERLKALVPKTKKSSICTSTTIINKRKPRHNNKPTASSLPIKTTNKLHSQLQPPPQPQLQHNTKIIPATTATTTTAIKKETEQPKYHISEQEQQHFIYFIKQWTSTGIYTRDYSYFSPISSHSSSTSSSSSSLSSSYFHYNPFP